MLQLQSCFHTERDLSAVSALSQYTDEVRVACFGHHGAAGTLAKNSCCISQSETLARDVLVSKTNMEEKLIVRSPPKLYDLIDRNLLMVAPPTRCKSVKFRLDHFCTAPKSHAEC